MPDEQYEETYWHPHGLTVDEQEQLWTAALQEIETQFLEAPHTQTTQKEGR